MSGNAKPCPFCGHKATFAESEPAVIRKWFWYCPNCAAHGPNVYMHHRSAEDCKRHARQLWNTRAEGER